MTHGEKEQADRDRIWLVLEVLREARGFLTRRGADAPRLDAELLLARVLGCTRLELYLRHAMPLDQRDRGAYRALLERRGSGEPTAYILGEREFYGLRLAVDRRCLIPRPETEHLVDEALARLRARRGNPAARVLDLGTGSGCITIALAHDFPEATFVAVDISEAALEIARANAAALVPEANLTFLQGDLLEPVAEQAAFNLILCNPPYIAPGERESIQATVRDFEPALALFSPADPFLVHRRVLQEGLPLLAEDGVFLLELPGTSPEPLKLWLAETFGTRLSLSSLPDLAGRPRVALVERGRKARQESR